MKLFLRIINNDTRRNWTLLAAWIGTLVLNAVLHAGSQSWLFEMTDFLIWLAPAILIFSWMNEECFIGISEFWMTRPLAPLQLLSAKLSGLLLWLSLPYLAYNFILTQIHHTSLGIALSIMGESLVLQQLPVWLLLILVAVLTRTFAQALILSVSGLITVAILANIVTHFWGRLSLLPHYKHIQLSLPHTTIAVLCGALLAIFTQARFRHRGLTAMVIILGAIAAVYAPKLQGLTRSLISPLSVVSQDRALSITMENKVKLTPLYEENADAWASLHIQGLPPDEAAALLQCRYTFETPNGVKQWTVESSPRYSLGSDLDSNKSNNLITIPFDQFDKSPAKLTGARKGRLTAKLLLAIHAVRTFEGPWKVGSVIQADGLQVTMKGLMEYLRSDGAQDTCKISVTGFDRWKSKWIVYLYRKDTGEQGTGTGDWSSSTTFTTLNTRSCNLPLKVFRRTQNKADKLEFQAVDRSWLDGASLMFIQSQLLRTQPVTIVVDDFEMPVAASY